MASFISYFLAFYFSINQFKISVLLGFTFFTVCGFSQQIGEYEAKSAFILKATGFIDWPEKVIQQNTDFVIAILGKDPVERVLTEKIKNSGYKIKHKPVIIRNISSVSEAKGAFILFIASSEKYDLNKILRESRNFQLLTVGDTEGFCERGVMINIFIEGSIKFNVNKKAAEESGIYISSKLLAHAEKVIK